MSEDYPVSFRLTAKERAYLYKIGGGTPKDPGKSANHVLRALLVNTYRRDCAGALKAAWFEGLRNCTRFIDDLKEEELAKAKAELEAKAAAKAAKDAEKAEWSKRGATVGMKPYVRTGQFKTQADADWADECGFSTYKFHVERTEKLRKEKPSDFD